MDTDMDDDVQSDSETVANAKYGLMCDVREAIRDYLSHRKTKIVNLEDA